MPSSVSRSSFVRQIRPCCFICTLSTRKMHRFSWVPSLVSGISSSKLEASTRISASTFGFVFLLLFLNPAFLIPDLLEHLCESVTFLPPEALESSQSKSHDALGNSCMFGKTVSWGLRHRGWAGAKATNVYVLGVRASLCCHDLPHSFASR